MCSFLKQMADECGTQIRECYKNVSYVKCITCNIVSYLFFHLYDVFLFHRVDVVIYKYTVYDILNSNHVLYAVYNRT